MLSGEQGVSMHCLEAIFSAATDPFPLFLVLIARYGLLYFTASVPVSSETSRCGVLLALISTIFHLLRSTLPMSLTIFAATCNLEMRDIALKVLCLLAWSAESRVQLQNKSYITVFVNLIKCDLARYGIHLDYCAG